MLKNVRILTVLSILVLAGCSAPPPAKQAATPPVGGPGPATSTSKHPLAKYIELSGFRMSESQAGKLKIKFAAINHSDADLSDLTVKVRLITSAAKPEDPPVTQFEAKIPALGPRANEDVNAE